MEYYVNDIIDGNSLTLDEYLEMLLSKNYSKVYPNHCFPSNEMFDEFISKIKSISDKDIKRIISRFIVRQGAYSENTFHRELIKGNKERFLDLYENFPIYAMRLLYLGKPWEGLTWTLDLLSIYPKDFLNVLNTFSKIYCQFLPDDVLFGLSNIDGIIRAKYFEMDRPIDILYNLSPEEFEYLIAELFSEMGYNVELTKKSHDGGVDIIAINNSVAKKEYILIQCKRYKEKNICVNDIRALRGVVAEMNATKGIFCTSSDYTVHSKKKGERIKSNRIT